MRIQIVILIAGLFLGTYVLGKAIGNSHFYHVATKIVPSDDEINRSRGVLEKSKDWTAWYLYSHHFEPANNPLCSGWEGQPEEWVHFFDVDRPQGKAWVAVCGDAENKNVMFMSPLSQ